MITSYLILTVAMLWFPRPIETDYCGLSAVICPTEQPTYIQEYIKTEFDKAGLDSKTALRIAYLESRYKLDAVNVNRNGSTDKGVFQINSIHGLSDDCRFSLECSTDWAIKKVERDKGFTAWTTLRLVDKSQNTQKPQ